MGAGGTIKVYADYDDERIDAEYDPGAKTVLIVSGKLEGWLYNSPSGAATPSYEPTGRVSTRIAMAGPSGTCRTPGRRSKASADAVQRRPRELVALEACLVGDVEDRGAVDHQTGGRDGALDVHVP
jgi:hypothetical protein